MGPPTKTSFPPPAAAAVEKMGLENATAGKTKAPATEPTQEKSKAEPKKGAESHQKLRKMGQGKRSQPTLPMESKVIELPGGRPTAFFETLHKIPTDLGSLKNFLNPATSTPMTPLSHPVITHTLPTLPIASWETMSQVSNPPKVDTAALRRELIDSLKP